MCLTRPLITSLLNRRNHDFIKAEMDCNYCDQVYVLGIISLKILYLVYEMFITIPCNFVGTHLLHGLHLRQLKGRVTVLLTVYPGNQSFRNYTQCVFQRKVTLRRVSRYASRVGLTNIRDAGP